VIGPRTVQHLESALSVLEMELDIADHKIFDGLVHPGNAVSDFHSTAWWMKTRVVID
jgi:1-deoxyxylulose-5-phosphate synthase